MQVSLAVPCHAYYNCALNESGDKSALRIVKSHTDVVLVIMVSSHLRCSYELHDGRDHMYYLCFLQSALYDKICE